VKVGSKKAGAKKGAGRRKPARRTAQNCTEKATWTEQKEQAALLVAQDMLSDELIAKDVDVCRRTLATWKTEPEFKARVAAILEEIKAAVVARGIADKQNRVDAYNDRWERMRKVIEGRAVEHAGYAGGGATGLLVRQLKSIGKGEDAREVEEYAVDTALLKEMREHEKQAAIEVGDWTDKTQHSFDLSNLSNEELMALAEIRRKLNT
jgi:hypothetical protein